MCFSRKVDFKLLERFGEGECSVQKVKDAEKFLLQLFGDESQSFDERRLQQFYDGKKELSLKSMVCCSSTIALHIKRAHLQANSWMNAHDPAAGQLDPLAHGYIEVPDCGLVPRWCWSQ